MFGAWVVRPDGSQLGELLPRAESAQWARERNLLAVAGGLEPYNLEAHAVYVISPSGARTEVAEVKNRVTNPGLSPNGRLVAYGRGPSAANRTVAWIARVDLRGRRRVGYGTNPAWSPKGDLITFLDRGHVSLVRARGRPRPRRLALADWTSWSPRGDRVALLDWRLAVIRPNGRGYRVLCCEQRFGLGQDPPAWSRRGDRLFYAFKATEVPPA
jgi:WD40-like Beta Propeller Repeat